MSFRSLPKDLIDAVVQAQQKHPSQIDAPLDMSLKESPGDASFNAGVVAGYNRVKEGLPLHESEEYIAEERKRTAAVADAFLSGRKANQKTLRTDGKQVTYHGNVIAKHEGDEVHVTTAGYGHSPSTRGHVNGILRRLGGGGVYQKKGKLMHSDSNHQNAREIGHHEWIKVKKTKAPSSMAEEQPEFIQTYNKQIKEREMTAYQYMLEKAARAAEETNPTEAAQLRELAQKK